MLSITIDKEPIKLMNLVKRFANPFDWIGVELIIPDPSEDGHDEECDIFAGCFRLDENNEIISLDGDTYSKDMDVWYWEEFFDREENKHCLSIWVRDF